MEEYEIACCICGYHIYREIWEAAVGVETLVCEREPQNGKDRYAVAVKKNETIVGHILLEERWEHSLYRDRKEKILN